MNLEHEPLTKTDFSINPKTHIGQVSLTVSDLERQIEFYEKVIGLQVGERDENSARLGAGGADLVRLVRVPGATRRRGNTGL